MESWSASPTDFFVPNLLHPLWGESLRPLVPHQWAHWVEKSLYLGGVALLLALASVAGQRKDRRVRALVSLALVAFLLALGPTLHWLGERVYVTIPPGAMALLHHLGVTPYLSSRLDPAVLGDMQRDHYIFVPLPMLLLFLFVPFTAAMRSVGRFGMITMLAVAALAGWGASTLVKRRWGGRLAILPVLAAGVVLFESWVALPQEMTILQPRPVDLWLAEQPTGPMVELPVSEGLHPLKDYYATVHQQPMVFGPTALTFFPAVLSERREKLKAFPSEESIEALEGYGTVYALVHTDAYEDWARQIEPWGSTGRMNLVQCFEAVCVYTLESSG